MKFLVSHQIPKMRSEAKFLDYARTHKTPPSPPPPGAGGPNDPHNIEKDKKIPGGKILPKIPKTESK